MAKSFDMSDRYPSPAPGRVADSKCKMDGGLSSPGPSPLNPMGARVPGYCADPAQNPGNCPTGDQDCDYTPLGHTIPNVPMAGRIAQPKK